MWYAKARYYNSDLGRFAAEDPVKGNMLDIQSLNLYPYVKNNPLKYIDPDGRKPEMIQAEVEDWTGCELVSNLTLTEDMKNAGVKIVTINGVQYYDFSDPINKMIFDNAQTAKQHRSDGGWDYLKEVYDSLSWFHDQVNHNAPWDIKRPRRWKEQLPSLKDFDILDANGNFTSFVFNGDIITAEDLGNITYGYWGRAIGFGETLIYAGGGYAAVKNNADDPRIYDPDQFYGDSKQDHIMIKKGIELYNSTFKDDKPVFDPGLNTIKILFKGYDTQRDIGKKVEDVNEWFEGLIEKFPWNK